MVPITALDCDERALRDIMPALGYEARAAFLRVSTKIMFLGAGPAPTNDSMPSCQFDAVILYNRCLTNTTMEK